MTTRSALLSGYALMAATIFGGCDGATPIGDSGSETMAQKDPDEGLPSAELVITNSSPGVRAPGVSTNAGVADVLMGEFSTTPYGRMTLTDAITVCSTGSINLDDLKNIRLFVGPNQVGPTIGSLKGPCATFPFSAPITQNVGETVTYRVGAGVVGGVNRYAQLYLQDATSISAHDRAGNSAQINLSSGTWPMDMSFVVINHGNLGSRPDDQFTNETISTAQQHTDTMASTLLTAYGEAVRVTALSVDLVFTNGLQPSDLTDLKVVDDTLGAICTGMTTTPSANPRLTCYNLNHIIPANGIGREWIMATFRAGAKGTVQACLNVRGAQGFTSLANIVVNPVCGVPMTVAP